MQNEFRHGVQESRQPHQPITFRNNLIPVLGPLEMVNLPTNSFENLIRWMHREYERLAPEQKRFIKRFVAISTSVLAAALGGINIYNNQKFQPDRSAANLNSGLWSMAMLPMVAMIANTVKNTFNNYQETQEREDDETASLSMHSEPQLVTDFEGLEMGNLSALNNLAVIPEPPQNILHRSSANGAQQIFRSNNSRSLIRARSFP
jgi:hypothetical protein